jgi:transcriptional regulator with XRE-family HTH domain
VRPSDFKRWRKSLELSQKQAAEALGLKRRMVQYYEKGERDGEKVAVPKPVRLACWALAAGVADYHGPDTVPEQVHRPVRETAAGETGRRDSGDSGKNGSRPKRTR